MSDIKEYQVFTLFNVIKADDFDAMYEALKDLEFKDQQVAATTLTQMFRIKPKRYSLVALTVEGAQLGYEETDMFFDTPDEAFAKQAELNDAINKVDTDINEVVYTKSDNDE